MDARMKAVFNWSGGKDSALALLTALRSEKYDVVSLLTTVSGADGRSTMHAIPERVLRAQAASIGIPLCTAVFGTEGTVLGSLSVPCATIYMFLFVMQSFRRDKEQDLGQQIKSLMTPLNISTLAMLVMLATGWKFSGAPLQFLSSMANCVVPTSMLIIGCLLSGSPLIDVLKKPILYLITLLRCLVMPLIAAVILRFTGWNRTVCLCIVMVLGCSVATVISIFGVRYDRSPEMASKSVLQSNLLLPVTMPLMMFIAERIL